MSKSIRLQQMDCNDMRQTPGVWLLQLSQQTVRAWVWLHRGSPDLIGFKRQTENQSGKNK